MERSIISGRLSFIAAALTVLVVLMFMGCGVDPDQSDDNQQSGSEIKLLPIPGDSIIGQMAYSPDGSVIAVYGYTPVPNKDSFKVVDPYIAIYDANTGAFVRKIPGELTPVEFNPNGTRLIAIEYVGEVRLVMFDVQTGARLFTLPQRLGGFMHGGDRILVQRLRENQFITRAFDIHSAVSGELLHSVDIPEIQMHQLTITPDNRYVMIRQADCNVGNLYLMDLETGEKSTTYSQTTVGGQDAASQDGLLVGLTNYIDGTTEFYEPSTGNRTSVITRSVENYREIQISNDKATFAQIEEQAGPIYTINLRRISDGSLIRTVATGDQYPVKLSFSADGKKLAAGFVDGASIFDVQ